MDSEWIQLDIERVVTIGVYGSPVRDAACWIEKPDLSNVDEIGFADLMPGTGDDPGGWVNVGRIEVWDRAVRRRATHLGGLINTFNPIPK